MIMQRLKFLKTYNQDREKDSKSQVFVTEHLPNELYQQKKKLLSLYKEARRNHKQASWMHKKGEYCVNQFSYLFRHPRLSTSASPTMPTLQL